MISSKKITILSVILTLLILVLTLSAVLFHEKLFPQNRNDTVILGNGHTVTLTGEDLYSEPPSFGCVKIVLDNDRVLCSSKKVSVDNSHITINGGGVYIISGTLENGHITVNSTDNNTVRLVLDNVSITSKDYSAIVIEQAEKTVISLPEGTKNTVTDGKSYTVSSETVDIPTAAVYSRDDLTINGKGSLTVNGNAYDGIKANDNLIITECNITVNSADEGINANDSIYIPNARINIASVSDSIRCEGTDVSKNFIAIDNSELTIRSDADGIYCAGAVYSQNTFFDISTGNGAEETVPAGEYGGGKGGFRSSGNTPVNDAPSTKAVKAGTHLSLINVYCIIDSEDDALHSDGDIFIKDGNYDISTGNDAVHAEKELVMSPEEFRIAKCLEGLEGAYITVNSGNISIVSRDDAINAVGYNSSGFTKPMMGNSNEPINQEDIYLNINGGTILVETSGDGVDSNGAARISGGNIYVYGPENGGNGSLDFQNGLLIDGGTILAAGSSGMAELPHGDSEQISLSFYLAENYSAGSRIEIADKDGKILISGNSSKRFNWVCASCPELREKETYYLLIDGENILDIIVSDKVASVGKKSGRR